MEKAIFCSTCRAHMSKEPTKKLVCIKDILLGKRESLITISKLGAGPRLTNQSRHHPKKKATPRITELGNKNKELHKWFNSIVNLSFQNSFRF